MAAILAALIAAFWIVPGTLDWNRYRSSIASLVAAGIGRPVEIDGTVSLSLLPQPILTASDLKLSDAGDGVALSARELRLRVALGPLLAGRVDARELVLRGAELHLPWPLPSGALGRRPPAWLTFLQARVEDSRLQIGDLLLSDIDASLRSDPDTGTLSSAGEAKLFGLGWHFTARLGRPGPDGQAPLDVSLDGQGRLRDTGGTFTGALGDGGGLAGRVAARGPDLSQVMPAPSVPWRGDGRLSAASGLAIADELAIEIGGSPARGAVALRVQPDARLDVALTASRLDLDAWVPVLLRAAQGTKVLDLPTGIDLSAEAATFAGGALRELRTAFDIDANGVDLHETTATLPGDAKLTLQGRFPRARGGPSFEGTARLSAPELRTTLRWVEPFVPALLREVPAGALQTANVAAKVAADASQISFTDLKGALDGSGAQGGLALRLGARPGVSAGLALDRAWLDPWLPATLDLSAPTETYDALTRSLATAGFDADVKLQIRRAIWRGSSFGPLSIDAQTEAGRLTLRRLEVAALGAQVAASGTLGEGGRVSETRLEANIQDVTALRPLLPPDWHLSPAMFTGPASLLLQASGPADALALRVSGELSDLRFEAQPVLNIPARRWAGPVMAHHPNAVRLLGQLGLAGTNGWLGDGSFSIIAQSSMAPGQTDLNNVELVAGGLRTAGQLTVKGRTLTGRLRADSLPLPLPPARAPDPLPIEALRRYGGSIHLDAKEVLFDLVPAVQNLAAEISLGDDTLALQGVSALVSGGSVSGQADLALSGKPRLAVRLQSGDVAIAGPLLGGTLDVSSGVLSGQMTLQGEGFSPAALLATLSGSGSGEIRNAGVVGLDLVAARNAFTALGSTGVAANAAPLNAALRAALDGGQTTFDRLGLDATMERGVVTLRANGQSRDGFAALSVTTDLQRLETEGRLVLKPGEALPDVPARLSGPAAGPKRTPELAGIARWLAERP